MDSRVGPVEQTVASDGVPVAYQGIGQGPPVLWVPNPGFPLRIYEETVARPSLGPKLHRSCTLVSWEHRGIGYSDRSTADFSMDALIRDASAVVEAIGPPIPVFATAFSGPIAITLAAQRPDLVSQLVLVDTGAVGEELHQIDRYRALSALLDIKFDFMVDYLARSVYRLQDSAASAVVDLFRDEVDPAVLRQAWDSARLHDARDIASAVTAPTMIVEQAGTLYEASPLTRDLSRLFSGASLTRARDVDYAAERIVSFLFDSAPESAHGAFRTIMFTDLVSSTALTQRVGDDAAQEVVEVHDQAVRQALDAHNGVQVKHTGDGIMAAFDSATDAARAAQQLANRLHNAGVRVRVGLNAGEPIERDGDLFGTAVQLAARLGDAASEGQVLATQVVRDLTAGKGLNWSPAPAIDAKGFNDPIAVFALDID